MAIHTRVRNAVHSEIQNLSKKKIAELKSAARNKGGYGVCQMVRELQSGQGFFVLCEEERRFSHVYTTAKESKKDVSVVRGQDDDGNLGYWVVHN
jgi:hypothetical protein